MLQRVSESKALQHGAVPFISQGEPSEAATVAAYVAHVEQGLGEVVRRLEKKVDGVAQLLDQVRAQQQIGLPQARRVDIPKQCGCCTLMLMSPCRSTPVLLTLLP